MSTVFNLIHRHRLLAVWCLLLGWMLLVPTPAAAQIDLSDPIPLQGYAWAGAGVGWISMSCDTAGDCDGSGNGYGVEVLPSGMLDGYAWSSNIGWIKFGGLSNFPPNNDGTQARNAELQDNGQLVGWARACAATPDGDCVDTMVTTQKLSEYVLEMAVGLHPENVTYDVDSNGRVDVSDSLEILRVEDGLESDAAIQALIDDWESSQGTAATIGGWDGWISLSGNGYGLEFATTPAGNGSYPVTSSYAWGGPTVMGWIDFSDVTLAGPPVSATLSANGCTIDKGESDCNVMVTWDAQGATNPRVVMENVVNVSYDNNGSEAVTATGANSSYTVELRMDDRDNLTETVTVSCATGSTWDGSRCLEDEPTLSANGCTIDKDASNCDATVTWNAQGASNPRVWLSGGIGNVATAINNDSLQPSLSGANSSYTVELRMDDRDNLTETVTVSCATDTTWDGSRCLEDEPDLPDLVIPNTGRGDNWTGYNNTNGEYTGVDFIFRMRNDDHGDNSTTTAYYPETGSRQTDVSWRFTYEDTHRNNNDGSSNGTIGQSIDVGDSVTVTVDVGTLQFGIYDLTAMADADQVITELDETNNRANQPFTVELPPQDPDMDLTTADSQIIRSGDWAEIEWDTKATYPMDCTLSGPGINRSFNPANDGPSGSEFTTERYNTSIYTLTCQVEYAGFDDMTFSASTRVEVIPRLEEI